MRQVKRSLYLFLFVEDDLHFDTTALLEGRLEVSAQARVVAVSVLTASRHLVARDEMELLASIPSRSWLPVTQIDRRFRDSGVIEDLARKGILVSDGEESLLVRLRRREEKLESQQWHPYAALYHFMTGGSEADDSSSETPIDLAALTEISAERAASFVERYGPPPGPFHRARPNDEGVALPVVEKRGGIYDAIRCRKTTRGFDTSRPLELESMATLLQYVFGCSGYARLSPQVTVLKKTSPSGGSLHPTEAYPLVLNVEGLSPGLYHYDVQQHSLEPIRELDQGEARSLAVSFNGGQLYAGSAHLLIVMTSRFFRNQWKYRRRSRTYGVMLMDVGHLSQTFYLVAAELGLGAFFTAAISGKRIEEALGVDPAEEGAMAVCGCGIPDRDSDLSLDFEPFVPRETVL